MIPNYWGSYLVLDLETTNLEYGSGDNPDNSLLMAVWYHDGRQGYRVGNEYKYMDLVQLCEQVDFVVAHNAKFELKWLKRMGADLTKIRVWDTMIGEYVKYGNTRVPLDLGSVAQRYGYPGKEPYVDLCMKGGICPSELPQELLLSRCNYDVWVTKEVFLRQREELRETNKIPVMITRCLITPVLADIEGNGMHLNPDKVQAEYIRIRDEFELVSGQLFELTGGINMNSPKQLGEYLYDTLGFSEITIRGKPKRTDSGNRATDAGTLEQLVARTKDQKRFKELKGKHSYLNAALTKALNKFTECCEANDLLHANFNQTVTRTHRLSSSGTKYSVQFQNLAREHKPMFCARNDGWLMGEIDGAQLEFRIAAFLGQDDQAVQDITNGVDVHSFTAQTISDAGQVISRQEAKAHTFKPLFGGESGTKAEKSYYEAFKLKYSGVDRAQQSWIDEVLGSKKLVTCTGLEFFFPNAKMTRTGYVQGQTNIRNYPIQSLATADIIPIALYYMWKKMKEHNCESFIVNTIHDSVILEVHPKEIDLIKQIGVDSFCHSVYNYLHQVYDISFNVPLGVGMKFGQHWSEGVEEVVTIEP